MTNPEHRYHALEALRGKSRDQLTQAECLWMMSELEACYQRIEVLEREVETRRQLRARVSELPAPLPTETGKGA